MNRFLVFVVITMVLSHDGCFGNEGIAKLQDLSGGDYTDIEIPVKRTSYQLIRSTDAVTLADHANVCYFIHEGGADGHISCRLRFTRSKFNFNPFGLRFGKREESGVKRRAVVGGYIIPYLLQLKDTLTPPCPPETPHRC
ncbi:uncharacterized protein RB166_021424 [Leptodactylus fuscus]